MAIKLSKKKTKVKKIIKKRTSKAGTRAGARENNKPTFKIPNTKYIEGVGRRKVATARVRIYEGEGAFVVNDQMVGEYFSSIPNANIIYNKPFDLTKTRGNFAVTVKVSGSGKSSQLNAVVHGLGRALLKYNPEFRPFLKQAGLLKRDDRMKETRKIGMGGKARRKRQSPKR